MIHWLSDLIFCWIYIVRLVYRLYDRISHNHIKYGYGLGFVDILKYGCSPGYSGSVNYVTDFGSMMILTMVMIVGMM